MDDPHDAEDGEENDGRLVGIVLILRHEANQNITRLCSFLTDISVSDGVTVELDKSQLLSAPDRTLKIAGGRLQLGLRTSNAVELSTKY